MSDVCITLEVGEATFIDCPIGESSLVVIFSLF